MTAEQMKKLWAFARRKGVVYRLRAIQHIIDDAFQNKNMYWDGDPNYPATFGNWLKKLPMVRVARIILRDSAVLWDIPAWSKDGDAYRRKTK